jgi:predicted transcriptional regulator
MNTVTLGVDSRDAVSARFGAAMKGEAQGTFITFETPALLFQTLTPARWAVMQMMMGAGPLTVRELARRADRDTQSVQRDVLALLDTGVLEGNADSTIEFPYDAVHVDFMLTAGGMPAPETGVPFSR